MRPSAVTEVASMKLSPGPREMMPPRWAWCQGVNAPSCAEYWHSGDSHTRFWKVTSRIFSGRKMAGGSSTSAVPATGSCAGV